MKLLSAFPTSTEKLAPVFSVTAVLVKITTDNGLVGWGESCPGPNIESIYEVIKSVIPLFEGRNPWNREAITHVFFLQHTGTTAR